jgi:hypothetical protein
MTAAQREITELDEKLYLQVFAPPETHTPRRVASPPADRPSKTAALTPRSRSPMAHHRS